MENFEYFVFEMIQLMEQHDVSLEQREEIFNMLEKIIDKKLEGEM